MLKYPGRYKLHQYLKCACQWVSALAYKERWYVVQNDGKVVKSINDTKNSIITNISKSKEIETYAGITSNIIIEVPEEEMRRIRDSEIRDNRPGNPNIQFRLKSKKSSNQIEASTPQKPYFVMVCRSFGYRKDD